MTKRKYNKLLDFITLLLILFPLLMLLLSAMCNGNYNSALYCEYTRNFAISDDLSNKIGECINTFGIAFDGAFFGSACVIMSNALLIWVFRVFVSVLLFIPKFANKLINVSHGGDNI